MLEQFADMAELFIGWDAYPKAAIVSFLVSITGKPKTEWQNKSDAIYNSYHKNVTQYNFPIFQASDPTGSDKIVNKVTEETRLPRNDVWLYLNSLYTMAKMGKLETQFWNPKTGAALENYGTSRVIESIKTAISPVTQTAGAPAKSLITALLIAGGLTAIGIFASKQAIKTKLSKG